MNRNIEKFHFRRQNRNSASSAQRDRDRDRNDNNSSGSGEVTDDMLENLIFDCLDNNKEQSCTEAITHLDRLCHDDNDLSACYMLGTLHWNLNNEKRAIESFWKPCSDGGAAEADACNNLGLIYLQRKGHLAEALPFFEKGCYAGSIQSCLTIADLNMKKNEELHRKCPMHHSEPVMKFLSRACHQLGDAESCVRAAELTATNAHEESQGIPKNIADSVTFSREACNLGSADSCLRLGMLYMGRQPPPLSIGIAITSSSTNATVADQDQGGEEEEEGMTIAKNLELARAFVKSACTHGNRDACELYCSELTRHHPPCA